MNFTVTALGQHRFRNWFQRPTNDLKVLASRHDAVSYLLDAKVIESLLELRNCLKQIRNIPRVLLSMKNHVRLSDFQAILQVEIVFFVCLCVWYVIVVAHLQLAQDAPPDPGAG